MQDEETVNEVQEVALMVGEVMKQAFVAKLSVMYAEGELDRDAEQIMREIDLEQSTLRLVTYIIEEDGDSLTEDQASFVETMVNNVYNIFFEEFDWKSYIETLPEKIDSIMENLDDES
jgi:hypothetical protein